MELPERLVSGDVNKLKLLRQLLEQLLSETVHYLELSRQSIFRGLSYLTTGSYYGCRVQLIDLVSTLRYQCLSSLDGEVPCTPNHLQGTAVFCFITSDIYSMGGVYIQLIGTRSWHFSSNLFRGRPLQIFVRTIPTN